MLYFTVSFILVTQCEAHHMRESSVHAIFVPPLDCPKLQTGPKNAKAMLKECTPWLHGGVSLLTLLCFPSF